MTVPTLKRLFMEPLPPLRTADDTALPVLGKDTVLKQVFVNGIISEVRFHDVYLSASIHNKLISLGTAGVSY